jgi:hypothetical protein
MKQDVIAAALSQYAQDSQDALQKLAGASYDGGAADAAQPGQFSQADIDAAVAAASADLQAKLQVDDDKVAHLQGVIQGVLAALGVQAQ